MNSIQNIWLHPKTSVAGLLICGMTIAGVLSQQGITLGNAGTGTVVALVAAVCTALLGLLSRDPAPGIIPAAPTSAKLGVLMLCALLISGTMPLAGCSGITVAQDIVNWTPALQSAVSVVDSTASVLLPADAPVFMAATLGFDAASNLLVAQCKAYLANPSATVLGQLQAQIVTFQQQVNGALLQAARIVDPSSQAHALAAIGGVATIVNAIFGLIESISTKAASAQMAAQASVKISQIEPYLDENRAARMVASHYSEPAFLARIQIAQAQMDASRAGF